MVLDIPVAHSLGIERDNLVFNIGDIGLKLLHNEITLPPCLKAQMVVLLGIEASFCSVSAKRSFRALCVC